MLRPWRHKLTVTSNIRSGHPEAVVLPLDTSSAACIFRFAARLGAGYVHVTEGPFVQVW